MSFPDWTKQADFDVLYLGGKPVPCAVARVEVTKKAGLDIKKGKGKKKATITDDGDPPAEVDIEIDLYPDGALLPDGTRSNQVTRFAQEIVPLLCPQAKGAGRPPLEITHPNTRLWNVNVITPGEIKSPMPATGGLWTISIKAHEWAPAPQNVKKPPAKPEDDKGPWGHLAGGTLGPFVRDALNLSPEIGPPPPPASGEWTPQDQAIRDRFKDNLRAMPSALLGLIKPSKNPASNL